MPVRHAPLGQQGVQPPAGTLTRRVVIAGDASRVWSPWRAVVGFGVVSLAADMVYEGARSITGPLLASLGATATVVGFVTGAGEAMALVLRLVSGPMADRTGRYWSLTIVGYGLTAVCVPLLAFTPFVGGAGLALACALLLAERTGKAIRSPSKSALLARVAQHTGRGRGFAVHKALDQVGAFSGPLLVAALVALTGKIWPAMSALAVPGVASIGLLLWLRGRMPGDEDDQGHQRDRGAASVGAATAGAATATAKGEGVRPAPRSGWLGSLLRSVLGAGLPRDFFWFAGSAAAATAGLVTFGVIAFHLTVDGLLPVAAVPVIYAAAMAAAAVAALVSGDAYDRLGPRSLFILPLLVTAVPALAFAATVPVVVVGVLLWGAAVGLQDSTVKALVADLVPGPQRATAYGVFAGVQGAAAIIGGGAAGYLSSRSVPALVVVVAGTQVACAVLLAQALRTHVQDRPTRAG